MNQNDVLLKKASAVGIVGNIFLSAFKLAAGIIGQSTAMLSDAVHSLSDVVATLLAYIGVRLGQKGADKEHPYGHDRFENVFALILGIILGATGLGIGYKGLMAVIHYGDSEPVVPGLIALIAAVVSIVTKEAMFWYTRAIAKKMNSSAFMADAWHHRSDALSSIGALIGIGGARLGFPILDPIASLIICAFILKVAVDIFRDALSKMIDKAAPEDVEAKIRELVLSCDGVWQLDLLKTRAFGEKLYVDVEIGSDPNQTLASAHDIAEAVHDKIEDEIPHVKHVMVHVNPAE